jgi:hypothetical protein
MKVTISGTPEEMRGMKHRLTPMLDEMLFTIMREADQETLEKAAKEIFQLREETDEQTLP